MLDFLWKPPIADTAQIIFHVLNAAFFIAIFPVAAWLAKTVYFHFASKRKKPTTNSFLLLASACLVLCVACLRFCTFLHLNDAQENTFELIANSLLHGLKTLAVDDDFVGYLDTGKAIVTYYFPQSAAAPTVYGILYCLANILTPVFGGAFLINAIMKFLPKLRLRFSFLKKQYYFSELNERSLALAKSVAEQKYGFFKKAWQKPILIFTDTYVDEDSERSNELYQAAKRIGAICLNDDIVHFHVPSCREKWFFLMDENEIDNIHALAAFAAEAKPAHIRSSQVFVFYQNDAYALTEKRILDSLDAVVYNKYRKRIDKKKEREYAQWLASCTCEPEEKKKQKKKKELHDTALAAYAPVITRVRDYENLIFLLLRDIPLFNPLLRTEKRKNITAPAEVDNKEPQLNVTVLGAGNIGMQMLLSASWCGQMFGHSLGLNMVSIEDVEHVRKHIEQVCPEFLKSAQTDSDLLCIFDGREDRNKPYFTLRYAKADLVVQNLSDISCKSVVDGGDSHHLLTSDYYVVALGSDEQNIATAELLARKIAVYHKENNIDKDVEIVMFVYDPKICSLFESNEDLNEYAKNHIHIHAYGSLDFIYSISNITLIRDNPYAIAMNRNYAALFAEQGRTETVMQSRQNEVYNAWSSLARAFHLNYRVYSAHRFLQSSLCAGNGKPLLTEIEITPEAYERYITMVLPDANKDCEQNGFDPALANYLAWLEHRRWNAYLRSIGFITNKNNKEKDLVLKLHNCLVETKHLPYCHSWYRDGSTGNCDICRYRIGCAALCATTENGQVSPLKDKLDVISDAVGTEYKVFDNPSQSDEKLSKNLVVVKKNGEKKRNNYFGFRNTK